jgi:hypothetical protein
VTVAVVICSIAAIGVSAAPADDAAIRDVEVRQASAWNGHDAQRVCGSFTPDGDVVNVLGWWWRRARSTN